MKKTLLSKTSTLIALAVGSLFLACMIASAKEPDQLTASDLVNGVPKTTIVPPHAPNGQGHARSGIPNIDSLVNFSDHYFAYGVDSNGHAVREWYTNTVGNPPNTRAPRL
jgi:hypothetical protein